MDISPEFLYGVATVIGLAIMGVTMYGWVYKVPVSAILLALSELKDFVVQQAAKAEVAKKKEVVIEISETKDEDKKEALQ